MLHNNEYTDAYKAAYETEVLSQLDPDYRIDWSTSRHSVFAYMWVAILLAPNGMRYTNYINSELMSQPVIDRAFLTLMAKDVVNSVTRYPTPEDFRAQFSGPKQPD